VHVFQLVKAGANDVVREMFDSSLRAGRYVLENMGLTEFEAAQAETVFYHHDRDSLRELADLWDPTLPAAQNTAYVERARALNKELEVMLLAQLEENKPAEAS
jgi:CPA2 family monovalent cation:H+ antiporter-2